MNKGKHRILWTDEEDQILIAGRKAGKTCAEVSKDLPGRSAEAAQIRFLKLYHSTRGDELEIQDKTLWTPAEDELLFAGLAAGLKYAAICEQLPGRSPWAARSRVKHLRNADEDERPEYAPPAKPGISPEEAGSAALLKAMLRFYENRKLAA